MSSSQKNTFQNTSLSSKKTIVVLGGGPAGSICASVLAKYGEHNVVLIEKSRHPRHHVGESLQPAIMDILEQHLGAG